MVRPGDAAGCVVLPGGAGCCSCGLGLGVGAGSLGGFVVGGVGLNGPLQSRVESCSTLEVAGGETFSGLSLLVGEVVLAGLAQGCGLGL